MPVAVGTGRPRRVDGPRGPGRVGVGRRGGARSPAGPGRHRRESAARPAVDSARAAAADRARPAGAAPRSSRGESRAPSRAYGGKRASGGAGLVVFPELGLTGYLLQDLTAEVAMRLDDPRLDRAARARPRASRRSSRSSRSPRDHRLFIAAALLEDGEIRHVHRKVFLPTYGLFDERRFFAAGDVLRAVPSRLGVGVGIAVCEDFWHLATPQLLALDGAQILVNVSSSPGRDLAAINEVGLGTATSWRTLMRTYAQLTTSFVVFVNRVGVDESITFWGGSEVIGPTGAGRLRAPLYDEGLFVVDVDLADLRRERIGLPLLRDERPELEARRSSIVHRRGSAVHAGRSPTPEPTVPGRDAWRSRRAACDDGRVGPAGSSRPGVASWRHRYRRRPPRHRRVHPGPASPGRLRARGPGLSGGIDSALVAYLVAEAIGAERLLCVLMPYRTSSPASRGDAETVVGGLGCASELVDISPMVDGYFGTATAPAGGREALAAPAARQLHGPRAHGRALRPLGDLARPGRRDRQQDRVAHRLHHALRRLGLRLQPHRRPVQEPGAAAGGGDRRARTRSSARRRPPTCGRARRTRPRSASPTPRSTGCCTGWSTGAGAWMSAGRRWASSRRSSSGSTGWSRARSSSARCRRSPSSDRGRPGVDYLYPRRRPGGRTRR